MLIRQVLWNCMQLWWMCKNIKWDDRWNRWDATIATLGVSLTKIKVETTNSIHYKVIALWIIFKMIPKFRCKGYRRLSEEKNEWLATEEPSMAIGPNQKLVIDLLSLNSATITIEVNYLLAPRRSDYDKIPRFPWTITISIGLWFELLTLLSKQVLCPLLNQTK